jgi:hypothetical protein
LKEHKEMAFMILGTALEIGTVVLAIRNGIKAKRALDELEEDATTGEKVIAIAPYAAPVVLTLAGSLGSFWYARHINIDKIISLGSAAAMMKMKADNQDSVLREVVSDEDYEKIQEKTLQKNVDTIGYYSDRPVFDQGVPDATRFVEKETCQSIRATQEWITSRFYQWKSNVLTRRAHCLIGDEIACKDLYSGYFFLAEKKWMESRGWKISDIPNLEIRFKYPEEKPENSDFGVPFCYFYISKEPEELLPFS